MGVSFLFSLVFSKGLGFLIRCQAYIAKFRLKLKKTWKTTRPFRYDLNQISYDYTVEVTKRFKGLDLIDRVPEELWMEVHEIIQERQDHLQEKVTKRQKWLSEEA